MDMIDHDLWVLLVMHTEMLYDSDNRMLRRTLVLRVLPACMVLSVALRQIGVEFPGIVECFVVNNLDSGTTAGSQNFGDVDSDICNIHLGYGSFVLRNFLNFPGISVGLTDNWGRSFDRDNSIDS